MKIKKYIKEHKREVAISLVSLGAVMITIISTKRFLEGFEKGFIEKLEEICISRDTANIEHYKKIATLGSIQMMNNIIDIAKEQDGKFTEEQLALLEEVIQFPWRTL